LEHFFYIRAKWPSIESLIQFEEIFRNFPNLKMFRILFITFSTNLRLTLSLCSFADSSKIHKRY